MYYGHGLVLRASGTKQDGSALGWCIDRIISNMNEADFLTLLLGCSPFIIWCWLHFSGRQQFAGSDRCRLGGARLSGHSMQALCHYVLVSCF